MKPDRMTVLVWCIAAMWLVACAGPEPASEEGHEASHIVDWGYEADDGPEKWGSMDPDWILCSEGLEQSPIDLANAAAIDLPEVEIHTPSDHEVEVFNQQEVIDALDNGHTIQINTKGVERMIVGDRSYALVQFHFHAPSEHTVDGERFPMEMHFVHRAEDGALAVVGVLIEEGAENPGIAPLWAQLAEAPGTETTLQIPPEFAEHLFPDEGTGVYHYRGSLTTPPCSEGVSWYLRRTPTQFSKEQIAAFTAVYDHNNRPVQALGERTLYLDENPTVSIH
jgi:carbonic anhydrase